MALTKNEESICEVVKEAANIQSDIETKQREIAITLATIANEDPWFAEWLANELDL